MAKRMDDKRNRMVDLAMRFQREAERRIEHQMEVPSQGTWAALFQLLVLEEEENLEQLVRLHTED
jgi:hypothetical protein